MKERMRHILCCIGTVGLMMTMGAVPAMADTLDDASYNWDDKVAANVVTYANIRESADADSSCVGRLPSGAVATVVGAENGWVEICSGEVEGYIREDLLLYQDDAKNLYEALHGRDSGNRGNSGRNSGNGSSRDRCFCFKPRFGFDGCNY